MTARPAAALAASALVLAWLAGPARATDDARTAAADGPSQRASLAILERLLPRSEREALARLAATRAGGAAATDEDRETAAHVVGYLVGKGGKARNGGWEAVLLVPFIPPGLLAGPPDRPQVERALERLGRALSDPAAACEHLRRPFAQYERALQRGQAPAPPLSVQLVEDALAKDEACTRGQPELPDLDATRAALPRYAFLAVYGRSGDDVTALVGGPTPEIRSGAAAADMAGRRVFLLAIPRGEPVVVRLRHAAGALPDYWSMSMGGDDVRSSEQRGAAGCLDLVSVDIDARSAILVDGVPVMRRTLYLPAEEAGLPVDHEVLVVRDDKVLFRQLVDGKSLANANRCEEIAADLRASPKQKVLLLVRSSDVCPQAGLDATRVRKRVDALLSQTGLYQTSSMQLAELLRAVTDMDNLLQSLGGKAIGAPRGEAGSAAVVEGTAQELRRQGIDMALAIGLTCTAAGAGQWDYTVVAQGLSVRELFDAPAEPSPDELSGALRSEVQTVHDEWQLEESVEACLARLLRRSYLRFTDDEGTGEFASSLTFTFETYLPESSAAQHEAAMQVKEVATSDERQQCGKLQADRELRSGNAPARDAIKDPAWIKTVSFAIDVGEAGNTASRLGVFSIPFHPVNPGLYLVRVTVDGESGPQSRRCVNVPGNRLSVSVMAAFNSGLSMFHDWKTDQTEMSYGAGIFSWDVDEIGSPGLMVGYGRAEHAATAPSSWSNVGASRPPGMGGTKDTVVFQPDGTLSVAWRKTSLLIGGTYALKLFSTYAAMPGSYLKSAVQESRWRASGFFLRGIALLDVGWIDAGGVPPALTDVLGSATSSVDLDIDLFLQLEFSIRLPGSQRFYVGANGGILGVDDLGSLGSRKTARLIYDARLSMGLAVGFGFGI